VSATSLEQPTPKARKRAKKSSSKPSIPSTSESTEVAEKSASDTVLPEKRSVDPLSSIDQDRPHFGVLKAVQAKMAERESLLSETVVDGADFLKIRPSRLAALDPVLTSTIAKGRKTRKSRARQRSLRTPRSFAENNQPSDDHDITDDVIPMVRLKSKQRKEGAQNLAYDDVSEV